MIIDPEEVIEFQDIAENNINLALEWQLKLNNYLMKNTIDEDGQEYKDYKEYLENR